MNVVLLDPINSATEKMGGGCFGCQSCILDLSPPVKEDFRKPKLNWERLPSLIGVTQLTEAYKEVVPNKPVQHL